VRVANVHHFATENNKQHLWMATAIDRFLAIPRAEFDALVAQRASEKFTHLRVTLDSGADLREAAERMRVINARGLVVDLVLAAIPDDRNQRERYVTEIVSRFAPFNLTWMGLPNFDLVPRGRAILQEVGTLIRKLDPYRPSDDDARYGIVGRGARRQVGQPDFLRHARSQRGRSRASTFPIARDQHRHSIRARLWNATMNGQYPASGSGRYMTVWAEFMAGNRYWELEPHFDVDGGRALALEGVEYIVYVEKFAPVEVGVEQHGYDVAWINANTANGFAPRISRASVLRDRHRTNRPMDSARVARRPQGRHAPFLQVRFASTESPCRRSNRTRRKSRSTIVEPKEGELSLSKPATFSLKVKRASRATRSLLVEWTAEVVIDGEGYPYRRARALRARSEFPRRSSSASRAC
jgi:hypothetical protein